MRASADNIPIHIQRCDIAATVLVERSLNIQSQNIRHNSLAVRLQVASLWVRPSVLLDGCCSRPRLARRAF